MISLHLYNEKNGRFVGNSDSSWLRRNLFLRQVVGYIQRHFPACYLQALVQGFYYFARYKDCKLRRDYLKLSGQHACKGVGYQYAIGHKGKAVYDGRCLMDGGASMGDSLATYYEQKNQVWRTYLPATDNDPLVACRLGA